MLDTNDTSVVNNNQQIQAREICVAGLEVMFDHMENQPDDYIYALSDPENINFTLTVNIPFALYPKGETNTYLDENAEFSDVPVTINVVKADTQPTDISLTKLIATATTDYALTDTQVKLEILYTNIGGKYEFHKGRFIN